MTGSDVFSAAMGSKHEARVFCFVLLLVGVFHPTFAKIVASFVLPHGGIALDPTYFHTDNKTAKLLADRIHKACRDVGQVAASLNPELLLLITPHGVADLDNFVFYLNTKGAGKADTDNCACPPCCYNLSVPLDGPGAVRLVRKLAGTGQRVSGLTGFGPAGQSTEAFPLRWGEVIPLIFIPGVESIPVLVMSMPDRRYEQSSGEDMMLELLQLGRTLYKYYEEDPRRVAVIISADLAHTHLPDGPYGYSNASQPFDEACTKWVKTDADYWLLVTARRYVDQALSCGYPGLVMLSAMLRSVPPSGYSKNSWNNTLWASGYPSYYGMMVASFIRTEENISF